MVNLAADAYDRLGFVIGAGPEPDLVDRHLQEAMETIQLRLSLWSMRFRLEME